MASMLSFSEIENEIKNKLEANNTVCLLKAFEEGFK